MTDVAIVRLTQAGTSWRSSTVYVNVVFRPLWTASLTSGVYPSVSSKETRTASSRTSGMMRTPSAKTAVTADTARTNARTPIRTADLSAVRAANLTVDVALAGMRWVGGNVTHNLDAPT